MAKAKKLPSGNWRVQVYAGIDENKKKTYKSFTASTKKGAEFLAADYAAHLKESGENPLFKNALNRYIKSKKNVLSPSTYREYCQMADRDFPTLSEIPILDITQELVQREINLSSAAHSPKTVKNIHGLLSAVMSMFRPEFHLTTRLPQKKQREIYIPSDDDIKTLLGHVKGSPLECPILLAATGGLRRSEISALTLDDVTDTGVKITKAMVLSSDGWSIKQPKTAAGFRFVPLPPYVVDLVRQSIPLPNPSSISNSYAKAIRKLDLQHFSFHKLRHYYASTLHAIGIPDKYIMKNGGWNTSGVLQNVYQHALKSKQQEEDEKALAYFETFNP